MNRLAFAVIAFAVTVVPASTRAQDAAKAPEGLALSRFMPAPAGDRMFGVPSPFSAGHLIPHVMLMADYARNPLVLRRDRDDEEVGAVVGDQMTLRLNATLALWNRVSFNVDVPLTVLQTGDNPTGGGQSFASPSSAQLGDLRLGARVGVYGRYYDPLQLAIGATLWLPTGAKDSFVSDESVRLMPQIIAGGRLDRWVWSFAIGPEIRPSQEFANVTQGTMLTVGAGLGFLTAAERLQIGPEINVSTVLEDLDDRSFNAEALLGARYRVLSFFEAGLGVGPGLSSGLGTPDVRVVAMAAFTPAPPPPIVDRDQDSIADAEDACPAVPGVPSNDPKKNGCPPPPDGDKDGVIDAEDACPLVAGLRSDDPKKNGCPPPPDGDKDGVIDAEDACPLVAGLRHDNPKKNGCPPDGDDDGVPDAQDACPVLKGFASPDPEKNGCPRDTDGDTLRDDKDACPREKGLPDPDPTKTGCPKAVRVTEKSVVILQQVQFDTDRATIKSVSDGLLDEVAEVLKEHPEILLIEVQGHTDNRGTVEHNQTLSHNRANSVMAALVRRGIDSTRVTAQGYGRDQPIDDNNTNEGRQRNRRVQFTIIKKAVDDAQAGPRRIP